MAINLELSSNQNLTLATIYCPVGNPNFSLFQTINNLSDNVMFVGDFSSKLEVFRCASKNTSGPMLKTIQNKLNLIYQTINNLSDNVMFVGDFSSKLEVFRCASKNTSGPMLKTIQNKLNLIYVNNDEHTHMDRRYGSTDILDMAFISQNLAIHDLQFQIGVDLGSDHLPIEISIDTTPLRNTSTNRTKYKFDQTDRKVFESVLEEVLGSEDFSGHLSTSDLDWYTDFIITALHTVVDKAIPISKSVRLRVTRFLMKP